MKTLFLLAMPVLCLPLSSWAQQRVTSADMRAAGAAGGPQAGAGKTGPAKMGGAEKSGSAATSPSGSSAVSSDYVLGPADLLTMSEADLEDSAAFTDKTFRIDNSGDVSFPLAGRVHAAGLTTVQLEAAVNQQMAGILKNPHVVINVAEFHSQPISVLGAVNSPGIVQVAGAKNLFEVLSLAGGLRPDSGNSIRITRNTKWGAIPLPDAQLDSTGQFSMATVKVKAIMSGTEPGQNIIVMPEDQITVPKGDIVYAIGAVTKPGGFLLGENGALSTLQVLSLAEGLTKTSAKNKAKILRVVPGSVSRTEIPVNIKDLMAGKGEDLALRADDILFVPTSGAKSTGYHTLDAIVAASGSAIVAISRPY